ncbi:MAG: hypothetical protein NVS4B6_22370 [Mycobacterium sp.]
MGALAAVPTMVAGIYGMRFKSIPELHWAWSYPAVLIGMVAVCGALYYSFRASAGYSISHWSYREDGPATPTLTASVTLPVISPKESDEEIGVIGERSQIPGGQQNIRCEPSLCCIVEKLTELVVAAGAEADHRPTAAHKVGA